MFNDMKEKDNTGSPEWSIEDALTLIRKIQPEARNFGFSLCLGGGVLNKGYSYHDLDIVALPGSLDKLHNIDELLFSFKYRDFHCLSINTKYPGITVYKLKYNIDLVVPNISDVYTY